MHAMVRLLALLAMALLAAQPVMACCLTGHAPVAHAGAGSPPPCHDSMAQMPATPDGQSRDIASGPGADPVDCPGCIDCDSTMMQAQSGGDTAVSPNTPGPVGLAAVETRFPGFEPRLMVRATGPPGRLFIAHTTPVTLKQRLLN